MTAATLLSEEFVEFSANITALHERKKEIQQELKDFIGKKKKELAKLDGEAEEAQKTFKEWSDVQEAKEKGDTHG